MTYRIGWGPTFDELMQQEEQAGARAVTSAFHASAQDLKRRWRREVTDAGMGRRLANTIRSQAWPGGSDSMNAALMVWSKAPHIVGAHEQGKVIRAASGLWLAIPLPAAGKARFGRRITPHEFEKRTGLELRMVYRPGGTAMLVTDAHGSRVSRRGRVTRRGTKRLKSQVQGPSVPVFVLVPQVRLRKRFDFEVHVDAVLAALPERIVGNWK